MRTWLTQATQGFLYHGTEVLFRRAVYGWCLFNFLLMLPAHREFWAPGNFIPPVEGFESYRLYFLLDFLSIPSVNPYYPIGVVLYVSVLVLGLLGKFPKMSSIATFVLSAVFILRAHFVFDGGDRLMLYMQFYLCIVELFNTSRNGPAMNLIRNLGFLSVKLQVCLVYLTAALAKFGGELWPGGEALYYCLHADEYTHPWVRNLLGDQLELLALGTYSVILYQLAFSLLIWNPRIRRYVIGFGTLLHLQIALVLGIASFGFALIVAYLCFYSNEEALEVTRRWQLLFNRLRDWAFPEPYSMPSKTETRSF